MIEAVARGDGLEEFEPARIHFNRMVSSLICKVIKEAGTESGEGFVQEKALAVFAPAVDQYNKMVAVLAYSADSKRVEHAEVENGLMAQWRECSGVLCRCYYELVAQLASEVMARCWRSRARSSTKVVRFIGTGVVKFT